MKKIVCLLVSILLVAALTAAGFAQSDFPKKEITIIVPFSAGGATDLMARSLQPIFKELLDVNIVVEDVAGGGSVTGITQAMTSKNDGYTLGLVTSSYIALAAQGQVPIMPEMFTNITSLSEDPLCVVVKSAKNGGKYSSIQDLLDDAIARPGEVIISQAGNNNANQACIGVLCEEAGIQFNNIPYDGASRVLTEIIGGHIEAGCMKPADCLSGAQIDALPDREFARKAGRCLSQVQSGEVEIVAFFTRDRVELYPDVPTFAELGYDIFKYGDIAMISYLAAPNGVSEDVRAKLAEMFQTVLSSEQWQAVAKERSFVSAPINGEELDTYIQSIYDGLSVAAQKIFQ